MSDATANDEFGPDGSRSRQIQEIVEDVAQRRVAGEDISDDQVTAQHPALMPDLAIQLQRLATICTNRAANGSEHAERSVATSGSHSSQCISDELPAFSEGDRIRRYLIERVLGQGAFGTVYLAHDDTLGRRVAIKVPRPDRVSDSDFVKQ